MSTVLNVCWGPQLLGGRVVTFIEKRIKRFKNQRLVSFLLFHTCLVLLDIYFAVRRGYLPPEFVERLRSLLPYAGHGFSRYRGFSLPTVRPLLLTSHSVLAVPGIVAQGEVHKPLHYLWPPVRFVVPWESRYQQSVQLSWHATAVPGVGD